MAVRAKFVLDEIHAHRHGPSKTYVFRPQYDISIPEDQRFQKASPSGEFKILIDNPAAQSQFAMGEAYYFDMTPVSPPKVTSASDAAEKAPADSAADQASAASKADQ